MGRQIHCPHPHPYGDRLSATVFIGLPVYNGERFISHALKSLQAQTHTRWKLLISDNGSTDRTEEICRTLAKTEERITYYRQPTNLGAPANFDYVLSKAGGKYFMWAAADDEWEPDFLNACATQLADRPEAGFAFTDMVNIDSRGETIRSYSPFSRFSRGSRRRNVRTYLRDYEVMGKANLIYSLFRRDFLQETWPKLHSIWHDPLAAEAGGDMGCMLGLIARRPAAITSRVLFRKRLITDRDGEPQYHEQEGGLTSCLPPSLYPTHCRYMLEATVGTEWARRTRFETTKRRWQLKLYRAPT